MPTRILPADKRQDAQPIVWRATRPLESAAAGAPPADVDAASAMQVKLESQVVQLQEEMERRVREAHQAGLNEAAAQAKKETQPAIERLARAVRELDGLRARFRAEAEAGLVRLAVAIARRILHRELTVDPDLVGALADVALQKLAAQEICRVRVHPEHERPLRAAIERLEGAGKIEVVADASLERGGVVFETTRGSLDSSIETQLREIERGLTDRLRRSS